MTDTLAISDPKSPHEVPVGRSLWGDALHRLLRDKAAVASFVVIVVYAVVAIGAGFYLGQFDSSVNYELRNKPPALADWRLWLGTDLFGRSVLVKTLLGARVSMMVGLMSNLIAIPFGLVLGAIAGYFGRFVDDAVVWLYTTLASIPGIILLIALKYAFYGRVLFAHTRFELDLGGIHGLYIALGVVSWIQTCRVVRAETLKLKELDYVTAARAIGQSHFRILFFHIVPNLLHLAIILFSLGFVGAITAEVILSFLGLGVAVGTPSWGTMINAARMDLVIGRWWEVTAACAAMFFIVLALNVFGDRLRDALDPKLRM